MSKVHLSIGTASNRINLIQPSRVAVYEWEPVETPLADTFSGTSLGDGRTLSAYREENAVESMGIHIVAGTTNSLIRRTQDIRRMLITARNYWVTPWQGEPVYLQARGACETNFRYAIIYAGALPADNLPWGDAFARANAMNDRQLTVERGPWLNSPPGTGECINISSGQAVCYPNYLDFPPGEVIDPTTGTGGGTSYINLHSDAWIDDLPLGGAFEVDGWVRPEWANISLGRIVAKYGMPVPGTYEGWRVMCSPTHGLVLDVFCTSPDRGYASSGPDEFQGDDWLHFYACYDDTGALTPIAKRPYLAVMGNWVVTYPTHLTGATPYAPDAAHDAHIASDGETVNGKFVGNIGWIRIRNTISKTVGVDFTPDERCTVPPREIGHVGIWIEEGRGSHVRNLGLGSTPGDIEGNAEWKCDCPIFYFGFPGTPGEPEPATCVRGSRVYNTGNISINNSVWTLIPYDTERWDVEQFWDGVPAYRMYAPVDGKYFITGHIEWDHYSDGTRWLGLKINGTTFIAYENQPLATVGPTTGQCQSISTVYSLSESDYVELWVYQTSTDPSGSLDIVATPNRSPEMTMHLINTV